MRCNGDFEFIKAGVGMNGMGLCRWRLQRLGKRGPTVPCNILFPPLGFNFQTLLWILMVFSSSKKPAGL